MIVFHMGTCTAISSVLSTLHTRDNHGKALFGLKNNSLEKPVEYNYLDNMLSGITFQQINLNPTHDVLQHITSS